MKNYLVAERYARALSESIEETECLGAALAAIEDVNALYTENHNFRSALSNPAIDVEHRLAVLHGVLEGEETPQTVAHLLDILLRRGRIMLLPNVADVFGMLVDERMNIIVARVRTAAPLDDTQRARLAQALETYFKKTIRMKCQVDPMILGGVVARVGSVVVDGSVRSRLERLRTALLSKEQ